MKRKEINDKVKVNGYYVNEFTRGFLANKMKENGCWNKWGYSPVLSRSV